MSEDPRRVGLLRAVNVAGRNTIKMADLRGLLEVLGFDRPQTLLQSGNVVFGSRTSPAALEPLLEREAKARLSLDTRFIVRTADQWRAIVAANPFPDVAAADPGHVLVMCLTHAAGATDGRKLAQAIAATGGRERAHTSGREVYLVYPDGIGRSKLTTAVIERALGAAGTARNWNTVLKLHALLS